MNPFEIANLLREAVGELQHACENSVKIADTLDLMRSRLERIDGRLERLELAVLQGATPSQEP